MNGYFSANLKKRDKAGEIKTLESYDFLAEEPGNLIKKRKVIQVIIFHFFSKFMDHFVTSVKRAGTYLSSNALNHYFGIFTHRD